ncbi:MAG: DUF3488 and transglutaminase-like domain-containing protein, partial [Gammaproteobacteria bacterium]|nr:DUF3488 and transglutaminase-like domain-containing protein [Gammaproteobacteria bacterium]
VLCGFGVVYMAYDTLIGPLAGVALLILAYTFKLLEARTERDANMVVILSYFVMATAFLFDQGFSKAIYLLFGSIVISASLISVNQPLITWKEGYRSAAFLILKCLPVMVILFVLVPRVPSLWNIQFDSQQARTGLSDEMSPGDIARLGESDSVAFRAIFEGELPPPAERYWRALVLDEFDGRRWSRHKGYSGHGSEVLSEEYQSWLLSYQDWFHRQSDPLASHYRYKVVMEASDKPWLFTLDWGRPLGSDIYLEPGFNLTATKPIAEPFVYRAESISRTGQPPPEQISQLLQARRNLHLPDSGNERSRRWALGLREEAGSDTVFIEKLLAHFEEQPFFYTLKPPLLGKDSIDQFLFSTRRGFCAHFASTFTYLARSAGIPARVVVGYLGGEESKLGGYLLVYQFDAHAWSEVWLPGKGWVRVDPTAAVAPERVENGAEDALFQRGEFLAAHSLSLLRFRNNPSLNRLRHGVDYLRMLWIQKVVGYDRSIQAGLLQAIFGGSDLKTTVTVLALGLVGAMLLVFFVDLWLNRLPRSSSECRTYLRFCQKISSYGYRKQPNEGETAFANRILVTSPELAETVLCITNHYVALQYGSLDIDVSSRRRLLKDFTKEVKAFPWRKGSIFPWRRLARRS